MRRHLTHMAETLKEAKAFASRLGERAHRMNILKPMRSERFVTDRKPLRFLTNS